jgi:hypothetical protein
MVYARLYSITISRPMINFIQKFRRTCESGEKTFEGIEGVNKAPGIQVGIRVSKKELHEQRNLRY